MSSHNFIKEKYIIIKNGHHKKKYDYDSNLILKFVSY